MCCNPEAQNPNTEASQQPRNGLSETQGPPRASQAQECPEASRPRYCSLYQKASALPHLAQASRKVARPSRRAANMPLPKTTDFPSHCMRSCSAGANGGKSLGPKFLSRGENHAAMAVKPSEKPCAPAVSQFKTAYKCCNQASQPTVHSSGAIFGAKALKSHVPLGFRCCWADFTPPGVTSFLCLLLLCAAGVGPTLHRVGRDKPGACSSSSTCHVARARRARHCSATWRVTRPHVCHSQPSQPKLDTVWELKLSYVALPSNVPASMALESPLQVSGRFFAAI